MYGKALPLNSSMQAREEAARLVANGQPFRNSSGSLWGAPGGAESLGQMQGPRREEALNAMYVIYSYATPIAWQSGPHSWVIDDAHYSVTTSKHRTIASAIADGALRGIA
jgi:hypothetical protein